MKTAFKNFTFGSFAPEPYNIISKKYGSILSFQRLSQSIVMGIIMAIFIFMIHGFLIFFIVAFILANKKKKRKSKHGLGDFGMVLFHLDYTIAHVLSSKVQEIDLDSLKEMKKNVLEYKQKGKMKARKIETSYSTNTIKKETDTPVIKDSIPHTHIETENKKESKDDAWKDAVAGYESKSIWKDYTTVADEFKRINKK